MTQRQLNCQIARITGEPLLTLSAWDSTWMLDTR